MPRTPAELAQHLQLPNRNDLVGKHTCAHTAIHCAEHSIFLCPICLFCTCNACMSTAKTNADILSGRKEVAMDSSVEVVRQPKT